jgi:hypothetical protein
MVVWAVCSQGDAQTGDSYYPGKQTVSGVRRCPREPFREPGGDGLGRQPGLPPGSLPTVGVRKRVSVRPIPELDERL